MCSLVLAWEIVAIQEAGFEDATAVLALPEPNRRQLRTSNGMERLNEEVRRRERVIRVFPNRESAIRLPGAVLMERHEQWRDAKPLTVPEGGTSQTV